MALTDDTPDEAAARAARRRERELSHYITKKEALALVSNLMARHLEQHHSRTANSPIPALRSFWRRLFRRTP